MEEQNKGKDREYWLARRRFLGFLGKVVAVGATGGLTFLRLGAKADACACSRCDTSPPGHSCSGTDECSGTDTCGYHYCTKDRCAGNHTCTKVKNCTEYDKCTSTDTCGVSGATGGHNVCTARNDCMWTNTCHAYNPSASVDGDKCPGTRDVCYRVDECTQEDCCVTAAHRCKSDTCTPGQPDNPPNQQGSGHWCPQTDTCTCHDDGNCPADQHDTAGYCDCDQDTCIGGR